MTFIPRVPGRRIHDLSAIDTFNSKVSELQREARASKKEMKNMFKEQAQKQSRVAPNLPVSIATMS